MTSLRPYWCPKTMERWPCWCPKPILWELSFFLMQTLSFVPINLYRCWPREWKHSPSVQLFRKRLSKKMCTRQSRKVIWDVINTLSKLLLLLSFSTRKHMSVASSAVYSKPPTKPFGIVACTFSDNLSRNSCMWKMKQLYCGFIRKLVSKTVILKAKCKVL